MWVSGNIGRCKHRALRKNSGPHGYRVDPLVISKSIYSSIYQVSFDCKKCCNSSKRYSKASSSVTLITLSFPSYVGLLYYTNKPTLRHDGNHYLFTAELAVKNKFTRDGNSSQTQEELTAVSFFSSSPSIVSTEKMHLISFQ